jgi:hypothetical protein
MPVLHLLLLPGLVGRESGGERSGSAEFAVPLMGVGVGSEHLEGKSERDNTWVPPVSVCLLGYR